MADIKISALPAASALTGTELVPLVQGGVTKQTTTSDVLAVPVTSLTASSAVATDASKKLVSVTNTGTGNNVLATGPTLVAPAFTSQNDGQLAGLRNKIINGNMDVWQRGTSFTLNNSSAYTSDRMSFQSSGTGNVTVARTAVTAGSQASINTGANYTMDVTGVAGLNYYLLAQYVEGVSTFQAKTITCSIYCDQPAPSGSYFRVSQVFGTGGSASVNTDVVLTSTAVGSHYRWTATIVMPSISGKTIGTANDCLGVALILVPSNFTVTYRFYGLQAEIGSVATPFEQRPIGMELALCQRYYYRITPGVVTKALTQSGWCSSTSNFIGINKFPVSMRIAPTQLEQSGTANQYAVANLNAITSCTSVPVFTNSNVDEGVVLFTTAATLVAGQGGAGYTDSTNGAGAYLGWSAEL